jgi:RHS repeat-associated protein
LNGEERDSETGATVSYKPDSAGRPLSAVDSSNGINYATSATYNAPGALTSLVNGNTGTFAGMTNTFTYNKRLQPVNMSAASPGQTVFSIGYDFHAGNGTAGSGTDNGNVWGITNYKDNARNQSFTYDALNRLTSAQNAGTDCNAKVLHNQTEYWGNSYSYDAWGNLLQKTVTKCGAENMVLTADAHNWVHATGLPDYQYDNAGNMTHDATAGLDYNFDQENRITGAGGYTYTYDAGGNRVKKSSGTGASAGTLYWYMTPGIVAESDQAGTLKSEYVFFGGERVARRDLVAPTGVFYYFSDHLKTASVVTDAAGVIKAESDYYPWGGELQFVANDTNHYKFTGKERDSESGLDYFGARYYSNGLGRFVSADWSATPAPVPYADFGDPQSLNLYTYVRNIPTVRFDADGHCDSKGNNCSLWDHVAGAVGGVLNIVPATGNIVINGVNDVSSWFGGPQIPQMPLIQPDEHASAGGINAGEGLSMVIPVGGEAMGEVRAAKALEEEGAAAQLQTAANRAAETVGPGSGAVHGTAVHTEFQAEVRALGNKNLSTEVSYKNGAEVARGTRGSIRVDAVEGPKKAPQVIHDLKTGNAKLTSARTRQIQRHVPGGSKVPVKEIKPQQ